MSPTPLRYAKVFHKRLLGLTKHFFTCFRRPLIPTTNNQALQRSSLDIFALVLHPHGSLVT